MICTKVRIWRRQTESLDLFFVITPVYTGALKKGECIDWMAVFYPVYIVLVSGVFRIKKYRTIKELYSRGKLHIPNELKREIKSSKKRK